MKIYDGNGAVDPKIINTLAVLLINLIEEIRKEFPEANLQEFSSLCLIAGEGIPHVLQAVLLKDLLSLLAGEKGTTNVNILRQNNQVSKVRELQGTDLDSLFGGEVAVFNGETDQPSNE